MRLFVTHRVEYRFSERQERLIQLLRMTPGSHAGQSIVSWSIDVDRDARLKRGRDGYGNETTMLYVDGPIDSIALTVSGEVLTEDRAGVIGAAAEPLPPLYFLQPTELTRPDDIARTLAAEDEPSACTLAGAHRLAERVSETLADDDRTIGAAGAAARLIAAARLKGYPARFVAGHLYRPETEASHEAHSWAELFVQDYGWIGFDPLEGRCPTDAYVRVAIGLDRAQAAPIAGARSGRGAESLAIDAFVRPEPQ